jgi:hypothetical protein
MLFDPLHADVRLPRGPGSGRGTDKSTDKHETRARKWLRTRVYRGARGEI